MKQESYGFSRAECQEEAMELLSYSHEKRLEMEEKNYWDAYSKLFSGLDFESNFTKKASCLKKDDKLCTVLKSMALVLVDSTVVSKTTRQGSNLWGHV